MTVGKLIRILKKFPSRYKVVPIGSVDDDWERCADM